jgi:hypothetical protein
MARVLCTLEHASTSINGVSFTSDKGQLISDEVDDDVAAHFASIPGFVLMPAKKSKAQLAADAAAAAKAADDAAAAAQAEADADAAAAGQGESNSTAKTQAKADAGSGK